MTLVTWPLGDRRVSRTVTSGLVTWGLVCLALLAGGCAVDQAILQQAALEDARRHADAVVQEAQAELTSLRAEMAATRIAAAKKEAELRRLRREVGQLRAAQADLHKAQRRQREAMQAQQAKLDTLRRERDRLLEDMALVELRYSADSSRPGTARSRGGKREKRQPTVQARVKALEVSVTALMTHLTQHTQDGIGNDGLDPRRGADPDPRITVQRGDTLWEFSRTYGVPVHAIRAANGLTGDLIVVGQRLRIPRASPRRHPSP